MSALSTVDRAAKNKEVDRIQAEIKRRAAQKRGGRKEEDTKRGNPR